MSDAMNLNLPDYMHAHAMDLLMMQQDAALALLKPSVLYRPDLRKDGNQWSALYGPNIQEGVCGFGDTPEEAMAAFDKAWREERITNPAQPPRTTPQEPAAEGWGGEREGLDAIFPVTMGDGIRMLPVEVTVAITDWLKRWAPDLVGVDEAGGTLLMMLNETLQRKLQHPSAPTTPREEAPDAS